MPEINNNPKKLILVFHLYYLKFFLPALDGIALHNKIAYMMRIKNLLKKEETCLKSSVKRNKFLIYDI